MVGFAVVGLGMGYNRAKLIRESNGAELKMVIDLNADRAEEVGEEFEVDWTTDLDQALSRKDVDVVMVMTPSGTHVKLGEHIAKAGKHVITTKPMDVSTAACDQLIAACDEAEVLCGVDYQSRYVDSNYRVAEAIRQGWLGRLILGEVRFKWFRAQEYFDAGGGWRGTWAMDGGGSLANQGAHLLDILSWFMGDPATVYGETAIMNHDIETEDIGMAIINFKSGAKGTVLGTTTFPKSDYFSAEVHGTDGGILINAVLSGEMKVVGNGLEEKLNQIENPLKSIVDDVVSAVTEGTPLRVDGREGRRTVALLEAIYNSARAGKRLEFS
ncbi:MAG: Gfo/Idh/MocA family oxidoreductase [Chloroflexota bacterium]